MDIKYYVHNNGTLNAMQVRVLEDGQEKTVRRFRSYALTNRQFLQLDSEEFQEVSRRDADFVLGLLDCKQTCDSIEEELTKSVLVS